MAELTLQQKQAIAIAQARRARAEAEQSAEPQGRPETTYQPDAGDMFVRGMTGGASDYVGAAGMYIGDKIAKTIKPRNLSDVVADRNKPLTYEEALQDMRRGAENYREENPVKGYGGEIAGAVTSPIFRGVDALAKKGTAAIGSMLGRQTPRYVGYGLSGAAQGLAGGVGMAQNEQGGVPTVGDVASSGGWNAALGGALGVAVPAVAETVAQVSRKAVQPALDRFAASGPQNAAARKGLEALRTDNLTPAQALSKIRARGPEAMPADISPAMTALAEDAAQVRGPTQSRAIRALTSRQGTIMSPSGQGDRLTKAVYDNLSGENFQGTIDDLASARSAVAGPKYKAAFAIDEGENYKVIKSPLIDRLMTRPDFQKGLRAGIKDALDEGAITGDDVTTIKTYLEGTDLNNPDIMLKKTPTLRILDAAKRGIDQMIQEGGDGIRNPTTNRLTQRGMRLEQMRDALVTELDKLTTTKVMRVPKGSNSGEPVPTDVSLYKEARDAWAGPSRAIDIMERGKDFIRDGDAEVTQRFLKTLSDSEKEFYRIGVAKQLKDTIAKSPDGMDKARKIFGNEMMREKLEAIFPSRHAFNEFRKQVITEINFANTKRTVIDNSATVRRQMGQEQMGIDPTGPMVSAGSGNFLGAAMDTARQGYRWLTGPSAKTAKELSPMFSRDPVEQQLFFKAMSERGKAAKLTATQQRALADYLARGAGASSSIVGGSNQ